MLIYSVSPPILSLIGALTTEIYYWTEKNTNTQTYKTDTDILPKKDMHIGSSKDNEF